MLKSRLFCLLPLLIVLTSACGPARLEPADPLPLPSPTSSWNLSMTQSGGFAGVQLKVDVASDGTLTAADDRSGRVVTQHLPPETVTKIAALVLSAARSASQSPHSGCADCFIYDLQLNAGGKVVTAHVDDTTLQGSGLQELVSLLRQVRDSALKSQP